MAIWIDEESKILIQGITGRQGTFHGTMVRYNTNVVGGYRAKEVKRSSGRSSDTGLQQYEGSGIRNGC